MLLSLAWLFLQLAFWASLMVLLVGGFAVVVLAPPYLAARWVWRRYLSPAA